MKKITICLVLFFVGAVRAFDTSEKAAAKYIKNLNYKLRFLANKESLALWGYSSNITREALNTHLKVSAQAAKLNKKYWKTTIQYPWKTYSDSTLRRQFKFLTNIGSAALDDSKEAKFEKILSEMSTIYSTAKVCDFKNKTKCDLSLEPELTEIFLESTNAEELKHYWVSWRNSIGKKCKPLFVEYVKLSNEYAKLNNFKDLSEYWKDDFESETFEEDIRKLMNKVMPLYKQLHAYVRRKLREKYGEKIVSKGGPIPAHLLGNMWAQYWNVENFTLPYPSRAAVNSVTSAMIKQGYNPKKMAETADDFFKSLNLTAMPTSFWEKSIFKKPKDRELVCHPSAWDFRDRKDFRIKMCARVNFDDLLIMHHEMGHIQYMLQYKHQPYVFQSAANKGFHEAIGDLIYLSVSTTKHLQKINLLPRVKRKASCTIDHEERINSLYKVALQKIAFLPFGYLIDQFRWDIFKGKTQPEDYNRSWWDLREKYQGVKTPVDRPEDGFDAAGKHHIVGDEPYVPYFVSYVIQQQFHKALCIKARQYNPKSTFKKYLHECDIYGNKLVGNLLRKVLKLGSSKPWPEAMKLLTGSKKMDASPLLEYFKPLHEWLKAENRKNREYIGWDNE